MRQIMELLDRLEKHVHAELTLYSNASDLSVLKSRIAVASDRVVKLNVEKAKVAESCRVALSGFDADIKELDGVFTLGNRRAPLSKVSDPPQAANAWRTKTRNSSCASLSSRRPSRRGLVRPGT